MRGHSFLSVLVEMPDFAVICVYQEKLLNPLDYDVPCIIVASCAVLFLTL
jgi:hypothetical protein